MPRDDFFFALWQHFNNSMCFQIRKDSTGLAEEIDLVEAHDLRCRARRQALQFRNGISKPITHRLLIQARLSSYGNERAREALLLNIANEARSGPALLIGFRQRSEEHTSELQSHL